MLVSLCALLETEWVLRSRYKVNRKAMTTAFISMLETPGIEFEHDATVEEALYLLDQFPSADFADCLLAARATHLGRSRFVTFDAGAAASATRRTSARGLPAPKHPQSARNGRPPTLAVGYARFHMKRQGWTMKLAELERDGWELEDGAERHAEHPRSFWIPPAWRRYFLRRDQLVKLMFKIALRDEDGDQSEEVERMWVIVRKRAGWGRYQGVLDNDPYCTNGIAAGLRLVFEARHVIQISCDKS